MESPKIHIREVADILIFINSRTKIIKFPFSLKLKLKTVLFHFNNPNLLISQNQILEIKEKL